MKRVVMILVGMMSVFAIQAQLSVSPEMGMTAVQRNSSVKDSWKAGVKVGMGVEYQFSPLFSLKSGVHYTQRGYDLPLAPWHDEKGELHISTGDNMRHFLQVPLMVQLGWDLKKDVRFTVGAGAYAAYCLHHSYNYGDYSGFNGLGYGYGYGGYGSGYLGGFDPFGGVRSFDWGTSIEAGLEVNNWLIKAGYDLSLGKEYSKGEEYSQAKYHSLSLTIGYKFRLGK